MTLSCNICALRATNAFEPKSAKDAKIKGFASFASFAVKKMNTVAGRARQKENNICMV